MKTLFAFFLALFMIPLAALAAGEEELYAPVPPADSAFVRAVNLTGDAGLAVQLGGLPFPAGMIDSVSDYAVIKQGEHKLSYGDKSQAVTIEAGNYYTLVVAKEGDAKVLEDALIENPAKAVIYFYNLSDAAAASLLAPSHNATIFEGIASGASTSREINAATLDLAVKADGADIAGLEQIKLQRQAGVSIFLTGAKNDYKAFAVFNKVSQ